LAANDSSRVRRGLAQVHHATRRPLVLLREAAGKPPTVRTSAAGPVTAAPASASSRGVHGLERQQRHPAGRGRPHPGTELAPGGVQRFELKYIRGIFGEIQYAAQLTYKIEKTNAKLEFWIDTTTTNNARCKVVPSSAGSCTAGGAGITVKQ
jgi:hypothetical protein